VLGNVTALCRELGISRTLFYRWRTRLERYGSDGLHPRRHRGRVGRPMAMPPEVEQLVLVIAISAATWGCGRIAVRMWHLRLAPRPAVGRFFNAMLTPCSIASFTTSVGNRPDRRWRIESPWLTLSTLGPECPTGCRAVKLEKIVRAFEICGSLAAVSSNTWPTARVRATPY
jgi:Homeodomain-like domain